MYTLISGYFAVRAIIVCISLGCVFTWGVARAQGNDGGEGFSARKVDLLTTQVKAPPVGFLPDYRFSAGVVLARPADVMTAAQRPDDSSRSSFPAKAPQAYTQTTNTSWRLSNDGQRRSPLQLLRLEIRKDSFKIAFRPHSVSIATGGTTLHLKSDLASVLWRRAF